MNAAFGGGTDIARRKTVQDLVNQRNAALTAFGEAHSCVLTAEASLTLACKASHDACNGVNRYNFHQKDEKTHILRSINIPERSDYLARVRRMVDTDCWAHVITLTDLETMMDKTAKDQFNTQLLADPPEFTEDNVMATLQQFMADAGTIFKRGIATCFSKLDRRFRSHDGWKLGSRIILTYVFDGNGWWNYHGNHRDTFQDIERVFSVLDGNKPGYCTLNAALEEARGKQKFGARQTEVETDYFLVRKNGNAHVWFKRDDLLGKVNQLLGEYYGAPIPEECEAETDPFAEVKHTPAKRYGFFPTPQTAAEIFLRDRWFWQESGEASLRVLEPSAGTGNLARAVLCKPSRDQHSYPERLTGRPVVDCVEVQPALADALRAEGVYGRVHTANFLKLDPTATGLYDRIVMNPPFDRERDIDHVMHALKFLKSDGHLSAIMSAGTEVRSTRKSEAFRNLMNSMGAEWRDLPASSFSSVGTHCNTGALYVWKNGTGRSNRYGRDPFPERK
jgi:hypothetical protein